MLPGPGAEDPPRGVARTYLKSDDSSRRQVNFLRGLFRFKLRCFASACSIGMLRLPCVSQHVYGTSLQINHARGASLYEAAAALP